RCTNSSYVNSPHYSTTCRAFRPFVPRISPFSRFRASNRALPLQSHLQNLLRQGRGHPAALPTLLQHHGDGVLQVSAVVPGEGEEPGVIGAAPRLSRARLAADGRGGAAR